MNTVSSMKELLERKQGGPCHVCSQLHSPMTQCSREALAFKIQKLMDANSLIPALLQHNKEVTGIAEGYRVMLKKADEAHAILMEILSLYDVTGEQIRDEYLERLNKWAADKVATNHATTEQLDLFSQGQSISKETEIKSSTEPSNGRDSGLIS